MRFRAILLLALFFYAFICAKAQVSHVAGGARISRAPDLGYKGVDVFAMGSGAWSREGFAVVVNAAAGQVDKLIGGKATAFNLDARLRYYVKPYLFVSGGGALAAQAHDDTLVSALFGGGYNYKDRVIVSVEYSPPRDSLKQKQIQTVRLNLEIFQGIKTGWLVKVTPFVNVVFFEQVDGPAKGQRQGTSAGIIIQFGKAF
jgi:hypothetical protein